jgi:hypothetical protein
MLRLEWLADEELAQSTDQMLGVDAFWLSKICSTIMIQQTQTHRRRRWKGDIVLVFPKYGTGRGSHSLIREGGTCRVRLQSFI